MEESDTPDPANVEQAETGDAGAAQERGEIAPEAVSQSPDYSEREAAISTERKAMGPPLADDLDAGNRPEALNDDDEPPVDPE